ncbi:MAG: iron-containing alcohol dehydrogenase [Desulfobacterales bacterium]|nr:iron-containing alcohol dehydrogenase [Desulfobacterales bacterium]MCP4162639.1 iron-containing alcohol dehydrogenase [Deltaproteobacteria bacterium]
MHLPEYYEFCCTVKTVAGHDVLESIPELLSKMNSKKTMIITDKGVELAGLVKIVTDAISENIEIGAIESDVPPDSDVRVVNNLSKIYVKNGCDSIIAVGGGSVLDTAKGVNIIVSENSDDLMKFTGAGALKRKLRPLVAVPTTSGTGSEVTSVAVIADPERNKKMAFSSLYLLPDIAVLDSRMTLTLPDFLTSQTAMDALTHAAEAYTCLSKNPVSDIHAINAIKLITENLLNVIKNPTDKEGRLALATAANIAGMSFSNSMVGMVHTLGHSIGAVCHVPHGTCMSILLPYGLEYNMHKTGEYTGELLYPLAGDKVYSKTPKSKRPEKAIEYIRDLNQKLCDATDGRHPVCLKDVLDRDGNMMVPEDKLPEIAKTALGDGSIFYNPEELDFDDILKVLKFAWSGEKLDRSLWIHKNSFKNQESL